MPSRPRSIPAGGCITGSPDGPRQWPRSVVIGRRSKRVGHGDGFGWAGELPRRPICWQYAGRPSVRAAPPRRRAPVEGKQSPRAGAASSRSLSSKKVRQLADLFAAVG